MQLLLFDVDGTLLKADGSGRAAIEQAVSSVTGTTASTDGVSFSGRTDPAIFRDVLRVNGLPTRASLLEDVLDAYIEAALTTLQSSNVRRLAGSDALLSLLARRSDVVLGLVTGNVEPIAYHKLQTVGLDGYFSLGAFGSDHADRSRLPPLAAQRAEEAVGRSFSPDQTVVIGDTPLDVDCARAAGARAVAVCTGGAARSELASVGPDLLLDSFENPSEIAEKLVMT